MNEIAYHLNECAYAAAALLAHSAEADGTAGRFIAHPLRIFSIPHFAFLAFFWPLAVVVARVVAKKHGFSKKVIWTVAVLAALCEAERILFFLAPIGGEVTGYRLPPNHLPFNICLFQIFLIYSLALSAAPEKRRKSLAFMYPMMVVGGAIGMLIPAAAMPFHGLSDFATYRYMFLHAMIVFFGFYLYWSKPFTYTIRDYGTSMACAVAMLYVAILLNSFFGWDQTVNHLFVALGVPAAGLPVLNMDHGWGFFILQMAGACVTLFAVCYHREIARDLPSVVKAIKSRTKGKK